jgi:hypothetical protein
MFCRLSVQYSIGKTECARNTGSIRKKRVIYQNGYDIMSTKAMSSVETRKRSFRRVQGKLQETDGAKIFNSTVKQVRQAAAK